MSYLRKVGRGIHDQNAAIARPRAEAPTADQALAWARSQLVFIGDNPVLRSKTTPVSTFDQELADQAQRMTLVMTAARGVGLAAPQIGSPRRLMVYHVPSEDGLGKPRVLVNPQITERSEQRIPGVEGCLSIPGIEVQVDRPDWIDVTALDLEGNPVEFHARNLEARIISHEVDHLDGILILDRASPAERRRALYELNGIGSSQPEIKLGV